MKYRIIKQPGEEYPYQVQRKIWTGQWRPLGMYDVFTFLYRDNRYATQKEAERALKRYLERQESAIIVKEIEA